MKELHLALIGGPQYDGLLKLLPAFEEQTGYRLHLDVRLPHVELNERMAQDLGTENGHYDLISTHTKYCPSQADHLCSLDEFVNADELTDFVPRVLDLCRFANGTDQTDEKLMQLPRNLDARLLFYRSDLIPAPQTWDEAAALMVKHKGDGFYGFAFPGRHSGLFGTFYEMLGMAGGDLFDADLKPIFNSDAGEWALDFLHRLHTVDQVTPPDLVENWYYDEISDHFRRGNVLMIGEWPGYYGLYQNRETCAIFDQFDVVPYPAGPAGIRRSYAGGHTYAIPKAARDPDGGIALAKYLTSPEVQWYEASISGHTPVRQSIFKKMKTRSGESTEHDAKRMAALEETITHYAMIPPKFAKYPFIEDILWSGVQEAMIGKYTPKEALLLMEIKIARGINMIHGFWHVSFTVSNIDASVKWYTEVLGMEFVRDQTQKNEYTDKLVGYKDAHLKVAQLRVPGETIPISRHHIELVEYIHPRGEDIPLDTNRTGVGHWAFMVDDISAEFNRLKGLGVKFKAEEPIAIEAGVNKGGYTIYFTDIDGITLELIQPPP